MRLTIKQLKYGKLKEMNTEVLFELASARAGGFSVVRLDVPPAEDDKIKERELSFLARILRAMKKRSAIQFFVTEEGLSRSTTEAKYLLNVFPEVEDAIPEGDGYIFVKL